MPGRRTKLLLLFAGVQLVAMYHNSGFEKYKEYFLRSSSEVIVHQAKIIIRHELRQEPLFKIASSNLIRLFKKDLETKNRQYQIMGLIFWTMDRNDTKNTIKRIMRGSFRRLKIKNDFDGKLLYEKDKCKFYKKIDEKLLKIRKEEGKLNEIEVLIDKLNQT